MAHQQSSQARWSHAAGIGIAARIPLETTINSHNKRYLTTKAARSGHQLFNLKTLAAEKS